MKVVVQKGANFIDRATRSHSNGYGKRHYSQVAKENLHPHAVNLYKQHQVKIVSGKGSRLWDTHKKDFIDFHGMYGATPFGHAPEAFKPVFEDVFDGKLPMTHGAFPKDNMEKAAERLAKKTSECLGLEGEPRDWKVYFNNTGAEAVEASFKFSRLWGTLAKGIPDDEKIVVAMSGNFHGRTVGTSLFDRQKKTYRYGFGPLLPGIHHLTWNDVEGAEKYLGEHGHKISSVIMEPIQGEGGINMPTLEFVKTIAKLCQEQNILIVADEVQSGLHRAGPFWASDLYRGTGFKPHIIASAKALGGGVYPVGGVIMDTEIAELLKPGMHGSTFGGNNIAMAVVNKMLDVMEEQKIPENVKQMSALLDKELTTLQQRFPEVIVGLTGPKAGLWRGIEIDPKLSTHKIVETLIDSGVITGESGRNVLRIAPPLNISQEDLLQGCSRIEEGFKAISRNLESYRENTVVAKGNSGVIR